MKNEKLRDYLFECLREEKERFGKAIKDNVYGYKIPDYILLEAYKKLLEGILSTEGIRLEDVLRNASD